MEPGKTNIIWYLKFEQKQCLDLNCLPSFIISDLNFTVKDIASLVAVSKKTVKNRLKEFGLSIRTTYSNIDDDILDSWVQRGLSIFPRAGTYKVDSNYK